MREQPPDDAVLALHRVQVPVAVPPADRHPGHEVVHHEVVEDDDARPPAEGVDDPGVGVGVVADVVERDVRVARRAGAPRSLHDAQVDALAQRGQEQRAVVGDARLLRRQRREIRQLHASSRSIARSQVTSAAIAFPARP